MSCVLCLEVTESYKDLIVFNSSEWQELNMKYIIEKYLWKLEVLNSQSYICQACWQELYNFHKFCLKLEKARSNLNDLLKTEEVTKKAAETVNEEPELEMLIFKEEYSIDIFEKEDEEEANYPKTNSKRKCSEKKSSHCKKNGKNRSRKISNLNENPDEIGIKFEVERKENDKSNENAAKIDLELKIIENDAEDNKMEDEEESICLKRSTKRKCSRKKITNDNKIIARKSSRKRSSKDKNKTETEIKKLKSDKSPDEIDKKLEVGKIEKNAKENSMQFNENKDELKTKLELEITENDAKQNKMEEDDQNDSSRNDADTSSDEADSGQLNKLSDEDKFIAENVEIMCDICEIPLDTFSAVVKHFKDTHNQRAYVKCCNNRFWDRVELMDHFNVHQNPEYLKCKYCSKTYSKRASLKLHLKTIHEKGRVDCGICGISLATASALKRHMCTHNTEDKRVYCKECGKSYLSKYSLKSHMRIVHLRNIICHLCGKSIIIYHFTRHMAQHEGKAPLKVSCKMCDRQFSDMSCLNRHVRAHHPSEGAITEFKCAECPKVFAADYSLKTHIRRVHDDAFIKKCTLCDKTFRINKALKEHMSRHRGEPLYVCGFCPRKFYSSGNMFTHRKTCSENRKETCVTKTTEDE